MDILARVRVHEAQMIADRRFLHEHPELSGQEQGTIGYIARALEELGLKVHIVPSGGVIGVLDAGAKGPCVLLRADIDALAIDESEANLRLPRKCISKTPGVMHACGHDAHTAMLLCAARVLTEEKENLSGNVLFVFEQGEEKGGKGFLENLLPYIEENFCVGACYATHVRWDIPAGKIAIPQGTAMAGGFGFDVTIIGRGGHGSRPDLAVSPVDCFASIHQQLSALRLRAIDPQKVLTYSVGIVEAGGQNNTIPERLRFAGTVRSFDTAGAAEVFAAEMKRVIACACEACGCTYELTHFSKPLYEVRSCEPAAEMARGAAAKVLGSDALADCSAWMASESMSAYLKLWPGVMTFTGIRNEEAGCGANHHTPQFDLDESAMAAGAAVACAYALAYLGERPEFAFERSIVSMDDLVRRSI